MQVRELPTTDMVSLAGRLAGLPYVALLDSAMPHSSLGRYSYLAADPYAVLDVRTGGAKFDGRPVLGDPLATLAQALSAARRPALPGLPPFQGGAIGYLAYEYGRRFERLPEPEVDDLGVPDAVLPLYDWVVACDHVENRAWLISTGAPETGEGAQEARAAARADAAAAWLSREPETAAAQTPLLTFRSNFSRAAYVEAIEKTVEYVLAGDIFQANVAQRFLADLPKGFDPWVFYKTLRVRNAAPFGAYLAFGDLTIASSSPERFVKVEGDRVEARPIKGTSKRWANPHADGSSSRALLDSEKDRAENVMIVDLLRNDLSRVCRPGGVEVPKLCGLETYASVHHLVSVVTGRLREGLGVMDLLRASFPGGSITGAPKLRAMEIIAELERHARGVYCGSIGWIGFSGDADFNIAIRTATIARGKAVFQAGGGITALSDAAAEYDETLTKARALFEAFGGALAEDGAESVPLARAGGLR